MQDGFDLFIRVGIWFVLGGITGFLVHFYGFQDGILGATRSYIPRENAISVWTLILTVFWMVFVVQF